MKRFGSCRQWFLVIMLVGLVPQVARSGPLFELLDQERWVRAEVLLDGTTDSDFHQAPDFGSFMAQALADLTIPDEVLRQSHAVAGQQSSVDIQPDRTDITFMFSLGTFAEDPIGSPPDAFAESFFSIRFQLNIAHFFDRTLLPLLGPGDHTGGLFLPDGVTPFDPAWSDFAIGHFGLLPEGEYILRHHLSTGANNDPELSLQLELIPIPLPAAAWTALGMLGLLALIGNRRAVMVRLGWNSRWAERDRCE